MNKTVKIILFSILLFTFTNKVFSQIDSQQLFKFPSKSLSLQSILDEITKQNMLELSYNPDVIDVGMQIETDSLEMNLDDLIITLKDYGIELNLFEEHIISVSSHCIRFSISSRGTNPSLHFIRVPQYSIFS